MLGEQVVAFPVLLLLHRMHRSIHFDHQPGGVTVEVYDAAMDHLLAAKMETKFYPPFPFREGGQGG